MTDKMRAHLEITLYNTPFASIIGLSIEELKVLELKTRKAISSKGSVSEADSKTLTTIRCLEYCLEENMSFYMQAVKCL